MAINLGTDRKLPAAGGEFTESIRSNGSWTVSFDRAWATVGTSSGTGNGSKRISVAANTNTTTDAATISFRGETICKEFKIKRERTQSKPQCPTCRYVREGWVIVGVVIYIDDNQSICMGWSAAGNVKYTLE